MSIANTESVITVWGGPSYTWARREWFPRLAPRLVRLGQAEIHAQGGRAGCAMKALNCYTLLRRRAGPMFFDEEEKISMRCLIPYLRGQKG